MTERTLEINSADFDIYAEQAKLEQGMHQAGLERYERDRTKAIQQGTEADTAYGNRLLQTKTEALAEGIRLWKEKAGAGRAGRKHVALKPLMMIDDRKAAFLTLRGVLNGISRNRPTTAVALGVANMIEDQLRLSDVREKDLWAYNNIEKAIKRKGEYHRKRTVALYIADQNDIDWEDWDKKTKLLVGTTLITILMDTVGICETVMQTRKGFQSVSYLKAREETFEWIKGMNDFAAALRPVYEPMVVPPVDWTSPTSGGYLTSHVKPLRLVKSHNRNYLEELANHDMQTVYDAVNTIQKCAWKINEEMLDLIWNIVNSDSEMGGMPSASDQPLPEKPHDIDTNEEAALKYRQKAARTYETNLKNNSRRLRIMQNLTTAKRYAKYDSIYMPWTLDFRGRVYPATAGGLSPQGEDYIKALLMFSEGEALGTQEAADFLAIHIANLWGVDKVSFEDRIQWTKDNTEMLLAIAENPYDFRQWCDADKPFQAVVAAKEWAGYIKNGLDHVSRIPVALDGSCSGLQNFGMALRCEVTAKSVNLLPSDKPADIYQEVMDKAEAKLHEMVGADYRTLSEEEVRETALAKLRAVFDESNPEGTSAQWHRFKKKCIEAKAEKGDKGRKKPLTEAERDGRNAYHWTMAAYHWLVFGVGRKTAKRPVMTFPYGSKAFGFRQATMSDILIPAKSKFDDDLQKGLACETDRATRFPFEGDGYQAAGLMAKLLWDAVRQTVLKAGEAMEWLQQAASLVAAEGLPVRWTTPLGFPVRQDYRDEASQRVETTLGGKRTVLSLVNQTPDISVRRSANGVAPNFVHSMDSSHLLLVVARFAERMKKVGGPVNLALIHDSFGTLPSRTGGPDGLFTIIREAFLELYTEQDVMENFREEMLQQLSPEKRDELPPLPDKGNLDPTVVLQSRYCFA